MSEFDGVSSEEIRRAALEQMLGPKPDAQDPKAEIEDSLRAKFAMELKPGTQMSPDDRAALIRQIQNALGQL